MSDGLHQEDVSTQNAGKSFTQDQVDSIIRDRMSRADERYKKEYEEKLTKERETLMGQPIDENALLEKAAQIAEQRLQEKMQRAYEEQEAEKLKYEEEQRKAEDLKHAHQYLNHVKDLRVDESEDPEKLFQEEGAKKYGALLVTAGKLNFENTKDILKEIAKKPEQIVILNEQAKNRNESYIKYAFKKIDDQLRQNQEALDNKPDIYSPVPHAKPSAAGSGSNKKVDWKNPSVWNRLQR